MFLKWSGSSSVWAYLSDPLSVSISPVSSQKAAPCWQRALLRAKGVSMNATSSRGQLVLSTAPHWLQLSTEST